MALNKQIHIYNLDTSAFYNECEENMHKKLNKMYLFRTTLRKKRLNKNTVESDYARLDKYLTNTNRRIANLKRKLHSELNSNSTIRTLNKKHLNIRNIISVFESVLTRTIGIPTNELSTDIMVVRTYFFKVLEDIMIDGFMLGEEKICLFYL